MAENEKVSLNEWTVMFLFAGDNELAPLLTSQVKGIKDAGFHENVEVLVHFDPSERGVPTRLLRVNHRRRGGAGRRTEVGRGRDSFVRNMGEDIVRASDVDEKAGEFSRKMKEALGASDRVSAPDALKNFLGYCRENHPAKNYMLFLFGHGMVVGSDAFLPDEHPDSAVTLPKLGEILRDFAGEADGDEGVLQLLAMHSCAMSAVEVAYELRGAARLMIGAQGIAYVGSWPYQNLMVKIFNAVEAAKRASPDAPKVDVPELVEKLYFHALHNGTDFLFAGYSLDLTLCSLEPRRYDPLTADIRRLVSGLKGALDNERGKEMILLAHWESQSYWDENYTDLYDFCLCLSRRCDSTADMLEGAEQHGEAAAELRALGESCRAVMRRLEPDNSGGLEEWSGPVIVHSKNIGSEYQYSHGLSVYFPWSKPLADETAPPLPAVLQSQRGAPVGSAADVLENYRRYAFSGREFGGDSWLSFLEAYFEKTQRKSRREEDGRPKSYNLSPLAADLIRAFHLGALGKPTGGTGKPTGGTGEPCPCPTIKNYPAEPLTLDDGRQIEVKAFFSSEGLLPE